MSISPDKPTQTRSSSRLDVLIATVIAVAYAVFCYLHPVQVTLPVFDELYTFPSAREIANGLAAFEQTHPPLTKLLMGAGYWLYLHGHFGHSTEEWTDVALGARLASPLFGGIALAALYQLGREMSGDRLVGILAAGLLACDGVFSVMSRIAMTNVYGVCFTLLGALATWQAVERRAPGRLWLAGVALGLALASRWTSIIAMAVIVTLAVVSVREQETDWRRWRSHFIGAFVVTPMVVYLATYVQPMVAYHGWNWSVLLNPSTWWEVLKMQHFMLTYHTLPLAPHPCASPWWSWPLVLTPAWFWYTTYDHGEHITGVLAVGNVYLWWASVPAMVGATYFGATRRHRGLLAAGLLASALWLVWAFAGANTSFLHYMLESMPFVAIILAFGLLRLWRSGMNLGPVLVLAYGFLVVWWFWYFQPLLSAEPLSIHAYSEHLWLGRERWDMAAMMQRYRVKLHLEDPKVFSEFVKRTFPDMYKYNQALGAWEQPAGLPAAKTRLRPKP